MTDENIPEEQQNIRVQEDFKGGSVEQDGTDSDREEDDREEEPRSPARKSITQVRELLLDEVNDRAQQANPRLRAQLTGAILFDIKGSTERYVFDWRTDALKIEELSAEQHSPAIGEQGVDCIISLSKESLFQVRAGDLNPQIAMLTEKIRVSGKVELATYFFNLVAPRYN